MARRAFLSFFVSLALFALAGRGDAAALNPPRNNVTFTPSRRTLTAPLTVYIIWYGQWPDADRAILNDFIKGLQTSDFWKINTMYYTANDTNPANRKDISSSVTLGPSVTDNYSLGKSPNGLQHNDISRIVYSHISQGRLPTNLEGGIYTVLLDEHVAEGDFCRFHTSIQSDFQDAKDKNSTVNGIDPNFPDYAYGWIGNPKACGQITRMIAFGWHNHLSSPNGNPGVDSLLSVIAYEIVESATNPTTVEGWLTVDGNKNGNEPITLHGHLFMYSQLPTVLACRRIRWDIGTTLNGTVENT
ncbi:hypothetical protein M427DRAFT_269355 [Gonapodya prolifera JEL478]|uniref:Uncharacterized protein n=1 Tax=Gonapodya prolifera (strain JEL478) TaxID=1344416 RepID=A0A139AJW8_GONPJ|nr:hypothetical protein M427DRAFT_269355 [Gonapodya prolifera JEL478]|eukprot:KXS17049.1 hypothetical protein M427DRAFT_269355 [Gonapodya prolifera JEL478]